MQGLYRLASPPGFCRFAEKTCPWLWGAFAALVAAGLYGALFAAPPDYKQGEGYRIIFVHVPAAWMSLFIYSTIAVLSAAGLIWRGKMAFICARESALPGASFTLITLVSGSLWGKPMWGAWWVWDARLTSELILLFLYLGYMALASSGGRAAEQSAAVLALVGVVNIPVIHFSVDWWNTLHQPASVARFGAPAMHPDMLRPLLFMAAAFMAFYFALMLTSARAAILERRRGAL